MLEKRKYKREEVEKLIAEVKNGYAETIGELKEKAELLSKENRLLSAKVEDYENQTAIISSSIKSAEKKAAEIVAAAENRYKLGVAELDSFCERFKSYFSYITEKYPHYAKVGDAKINFDRIREILKGGLPAGEKIIAAKKYVPDSLAAPFDPQKKINEYIAGTGDGGFNLDEVLNPGELHLEEICKELGLTEDE